MEMQAWAKRRKRNGNLLQNYCSKGRGRGLPRNVLKD